MTDILVSRLVQGLVAIGESRALHVFTADDGAALLDGTSAEHRVMTVRFHPRGLEIRLGTSVRALVQLDDEDDVDWVLDVLGRVLADGAWFETYSLDLSTGRTESLAWRLGLGAGASISSPTGAHPPASGARIHRPGQAWGRARDAPAAPVG